MASTGRSSSSIASSQAGVDKQLLSNLGDTDRQPKSAGEANKRDWLAVGASWLSKNALSRTAVDTITGDNNTAERPGHISRSSTHSRGPSSVETAVHDDSDRNTADSLSPRAGAQGDSRLAGQRSLRNSRSNQALPDPATAAMPSGRGTGQAAWKNTLKHYYRQAGAGNAVCHTVPTATARFLRLLDVDTHMAAAVPVTQSLNTIAFVSLQHLVIIRRRAI